MSGTFNFYFSVINVPRNVTHVVFEAAFRDVSGVIQLVYCDSPGAGAAVLCGTVAVIAAHGRLAVPGQQGK